VAQSRNQKLKGGKRARALRRTAKAIGKRVTRQAVPPKPTAKRKASVAVKRGQVWSSRDARVRSVFEIVGINRKLGVARARNLKTSREVSIRLDRFDRYDHMADDFTSYELTLARGRKPREPKPTPPRRKRVVVPAPEPEPALVGGGEFDPPWVDETPAPEGEEDEEPDPDAGIPEYDPSLDPTGDE
jgi:hypothetical protein